MNRSASPTRIEPATEPELLRLVEDRLGSLLPGAWDLQFSHQSAALDVDAVLEIANPSGEKTWLLVEVKRSVVGRDVERLSERLRQQAAALDSNAIPMVVSRYLSEPVRKALTDHGVSYVDATGNLRLEAQRPAVFVRDVGSDSDPWRKRGRPRGSLRGQPAALVVRALVDFKPPYSVPELVRLSGSSNGATYRVVEFLDEQALVGRDGRGRIVDVSWRALLEAWSRDYSFYETNRLVSYLAPRGIDDVIDRLGLIDRTVRDAVTNLAGQGLSFIDKPVDGQSPVRYAVTGSFAAGAYAPYAPTKTLTIYTDKHDYLSEHLGLRQVDAGANVMVAKASYDVVFRRLAPWQGIWVTAPSQTVVDLMTGPGRNPAEAVELLEWMEHSEHIWRLG